MTRVLMLVYGVTSYAFFLATFLYAIWFVFTMDSQTPPPGSPWQKSLLINALVLAVFALQHSVMARRGFKRMWTKVIPKPIERSTYVLFSTLALLLIIRAWQPLPGVIWDIQAPVARLVLNVLFGLGWLTVLISTFLIDHFELFGLKQVWTHFRNQSWDPPKFASPSLYRFVRHPIYLGFIIAFWSTPRMTTGHLLFAIMTLGYILVAIQLEERDLIAFHGDQYKAYRSSVSMLLPWPRSRK